MEIILEILAEILMETKYGMLILIVLLLLVAAGVIIYVVTHPDKVTAALNIKEVLWNT